MHVAIGVYNRARVGRHSAVINAAFIRYFVVVVGVGGGGGSGVTQSRHLDNCSIAGHRNVTGSLSS